MDVRIFTEKELTYIYTINILVITLKKGIAISINICYQYCFGRVKFYTLTSSFILNVEFGNFGTTIFFAGSLAFSQDMVHKCTS